MGIKSQFVQGKRKVKEFSITNQEILDLWILQNGHCALTGQKMTHISGIGYVATNASVDRINNKLGYVPGNIRLVCRLANQIKFRLTDAELVMWCKMIIGTIGHIS